MPPPLARRRIASAHGHLGPDGGLTIERLQKTIDFLVAAKGLPDGLQADHVADRSYLDAVLAAIGRVPDKGA
jgi:hypothetical protein